MWIDLIKDLNEIIMTELTLREYHTLMIVVLSATKYNILH